MVTSLQLPHFMKRDQIPDKCRALTTFPPKDSINVPPRASALSYFIAINISHSNVRIKIPKFLAKSILRKKHDDDDSNKGSSRDSNGTNDSKSKENGVKPRNIAPKKLGFIALFGNKKKSETTTNGGEKGRGKPRLKWAEGMRKFGSRESLVREEKEIKKENGERKEKEEEELCLCKKRILMGGRCKPLNSSGTLTYDEYGVLLPKYEH